MARDVEFALTASDKTGAALASVERGFKRTHDRIAKQQDDIGGSRLIQAVARSSPQLAAHLTKAFGQVASAGPALLGVGIAAAAPAIGATVSAAVIGGAGVGGVIGGVLLAARDPRVQAAGSELGQNLLGDLERDASVFVDPVLRNISKIEARFGQMNGRIKNIFSNSSGFLDPLVDGALDGVDGILRGVDRLVAKAKPVMVALGGAFARIGDATGDAFETIAGGADEAAGALDDLSRVVAITIEFTGGLVRALTDLYGAIKYVSPLGEAAVKWLSKLTGAEDGAKQGAEDAKPPTDNFAGALKNVGDAAADSAPNLQRIADATRDIYNQNTALLSSELGVAQAMADANKTIKENGKTLDLHTQKGRDNERALLDVAGALQKDYDGFVAVNGVGPKSAKMADGLRAGFIQLAQKAGLSAREAKNLADKILNIPDSHDTKITADAAKAKEAAREAQRAINSVHGKTVSVTVAINTGRLASIENRLSRLGGSLYNAAGQSWAAAGGGGMSRTGGPAPVNVSSTVESHLYLDGSLVYANTDRQVRARAERDAWRQKVGAR